MPSDEKKDKEFWERFKKWEGEWGKKRAEDKLEDLRKLRDAEEDYESSLRSLNPIEAKPKTRDILGVQSREPSLKRLPLKNPESCNIIIPFQIIKIDQPLKDEIHIYIKREGKNKDKELLEIMAFKIKKLIEHMIDERFLFSLNPKDASTFIMKIAWEDASPPFFEIALLSPETICIRALENGITWSSGYVFDCKEILRQIVERLKIKKGL